VGTKRQPRACVARAAPALAAADDGFGVVWTAGTRLGFATLSWPIRSVETTIFRDAPGAANLPRTVSAGKSAYWIVWEDTRGGQDGEAIYLARTEASGK